MTTTTKTRRKKKKISLVNPFSINMQPWNGMVTSQDPYTISEDTSVWINGLPKLTGAIEAVPLPQQVYSHTTTVKFFFTFELSGSQYFAILDGSYLRFFNSFFTEIARFATSADICDYCIQDNSYLWVVTRSFLITFDGSTIYNLTSYNILGDAICYWKGRIFIGKDRTLTFSVPNPNATGTTNPFNTASGAGYIGLTVSVFAFIYALIAKEDSIYIFTDKSIITMIGTTISNDPSQWYITEIVKDVGITGIRKYVTYEHDVYFHSIYGVHRITATVPNKIDDAITNITSSINALSLMNYNQITYIVVSATSFIDNSKKALYCYNTLNNRWYALSIEADCISYHLNKYYISSGNTIYKMFASSNYLPLEVKTKVFFNVENFYYNIKNIVLYGRGNYDYVSNFINLVYGSNETNLIFITQSSQLISFSQQADFWIAVYKPIATAPYSYRVKQFQLYLKQNSNYYSELINITVNGTIGARYV